VHTQSHSILWVCSASKAQTWAHTVTVRVMGKHCKARTHTHTQLAGGACLKISAQT
jgi:hypothetical protein